MKPFKVTEDWMMHRGMCNDGIEWAKKQDTANSHELFELVLKKGNENFICWALPQLLTISNNIKLLTYILGDIDKELLHLLWGCPHSTICLMTTAVLLTKAKSAQGTADYIIYGLQLKKEEENGETQTKLFED